LPEAARSWFRTTRGQSSCVSVRPSRSKGLRPGGRERHGATPEGACSPQQGATGRQSRAGPASASQRASAPRSWAARRCAGGSLLPPARSHRPCAVLARPSRPDGFGLTDVSGLVPSSRGLASVRTAPTAVGLPRCGLRGQRLRPADASGQAPSMRELAPPCRVPPTVCRIGAAFMAQRLRPEGRERHGARPAGACFCQRRANRRPGRAGAASKAQGFRPGGPGRSGAAPEGACSPQHGATDRVRCSCGLHGLTASAGGT